MKFPLSINNLTCPSPTLLVLSLPCFVKRGTDCARSPLAQRTFPRRRWNKWESLKLQIHLSLSRVAPPVGEACCSSSAQRFGLHPAQIPGPQDLSTHLGCQSSLPTACHVLQPVPWVGRGDSRHVSTAVVKYMLP